MEIEQIKEELRSLRYGQRSIEAINTELNQKRMRLKTLQTSTLRDVPSVVSKLQKRIAYLEETLITKIAEQECLESRYNAAISALDEIDQIIVREGYINGRAYAELGERLGYSVRGIEYRMQGIIVRLTELL